MSDYDTDLLLWSTHQAELLRRMGTGERINDQVDWANVAEEIESLGRSDRRALRSRVQNILLHLIKLQVSPATEPRAGWRQTILRERVQVEMLMEDSPSLRPMVSTFVADELPRARALAIGDPAAHGEQPSTDPAALRFTADQVLGPWMPG